MFAPAIYGAIATQWSVQEVTLTSARQYVDSYREGAVTADISGPNGTHLRVHGFSDGGRTFRIRWNPTAPGVWRYRTQSEDVGLGDKAGEVQVGPPAASQHGFLRRDAAHPYSFVYDDGVRYFLFGNTLYQIVANAIANGGWKESIDKTRAYGMNKIRFNTGPQGLEGGPFPEPDVESFRKLDEIVRYAAEREVIADMIVFSRAQVDAMSEADAKRFLRYITARYAAFPNVVFCLQNEWQYTAKPKAFWSAMGNFAAQEDPWARRGENVRGLSVHQQTRYDWEFFGDSWYSHAIVQLGVRNRGKANRGGDEWNLPADKRGVFPFGDDWGNFSIVYNYGHNVPVVNDEYGYIGEPKDETERRTGGSGDIRMTREKHRRTMWGIYAGGGYGSAGDKEKYPAPTGQPYRTANWHDEPEFGDVRRLVDFFSTKNLEYWKMGPHNDFVEKGERAYVLAEPARQYVVYAAAGGNFTIRLSGGPYEARRFDPQTGQDALIEKSVQAGSRSFSLPDSQDWVVYLQKRQ